MKSTIKDPGTERALLSTICQFGEESFYDVADIIGLQTFTDESNQAIFKCLESVIADKNVIDIPTLVAKAEELNLTVFICKEKTDLEYIRSLFSFPASQSNARNHAKKLAKLEIARDAQIKHMQAIKSLGEVTGGESIDEILSLSESPVFDMITHLNQGRESLPTQFGDVVDDYVDFLENNPRENIGIPTPFPTLNRVMGGGMRRGGVSLFAARAGAGKSTICINTGLHVSQLDIPVLYIDTEMTIDQQMSRILANLGDCNNTLIEKGQFKSFRQKIYVAKEELKKLRFQHKAMHGNNFDEILSVIRRWILKDVGYGENGEINDCLVVYDYFRIMDKGELDNLKEYQALGYQIAKLADFCNQYSVPCMSFVQTNRDGINKESADVISGSDRLVWTCHSCIQFKWKTPEEILEDGKEQGNSKLKTLKTRFGPGLDWEDYINLQFSGDNCRVKELGTKFQALKQANTSDAGFDADGLQF